MGVLDPLRKGYFILPFFDHLFTHSPIFIEFLIYARYCALLELNRYNSCLHGDTLSIIDWALLTKLTST